MNLLVAPAESDLAEMTDLVLPTAQGVLRGADCGVDLLQQVYSTYSTIGEQGLRELYQLGRELNEQGVLSRELDLNETPFSNRNLRTLSEVAPDALIALDNYEHTFATFTRIHTLGTEHLLGSDIFRFAKAIGKFEPEDFKQLVHDTKSLLQAEGKTNPLWAGCTKGEIALLSRVQTEAYYQRLELQPGGRALLQQLQSTPETAYVSKMKSLMGVLQWEQLRELGQDVLRFMRQSGEQVDLSSLVPDDPARFLSRPYDGLLTNDNKRIELPTQLGIHLARMHHRIWGQAREIVAADVLESLTARGGFRVDPYHDFDQLDLATRNHDLLNAQLLILQPARLPGPLWEKLINSAPAGNPLGLHLQFRIRESGDAHLSGSPFNKTEKIVISSAAPAETSEISFSREIHTEQQKLWAETINQLEKSMEQELNQAISTVLLYSDSISNSLLDDTFITLNKELRQLGHARDNLICSFQIAGGTLTDVSEFSGVTSPSRLIEGLAPHLKSYQLAFLEERAHQYLGALSTFQRAQRELNPDKARTFLVTAPELLDEYFPALRRLIDPAVVHGSLPDYSEQGGIITDYYDRNFVREYLCASNYLLLHRADPKSDPTRTDGLFMYYLPNRVPKSHTNVSPEIAKNHNYSHAELVLADPGRDPGTYGRLFRGMIVSLQPYGVSYSQGYVNMRNFRQIRALEFFKHWPQNLHTFDRTESSGRTERWKPMVLPIYPAALKHLTDELR